MLHLFPKKQYLTEVECPGGSTTTFADMEEGVYYFVAKILEAQTSEGQLFHGKRQH